MYIRPIDFHNNYFKSEKVARSQQVQNDKPRMDIVYETNQEQKKIEIRKKKVNELEKKDDVHIKDDYDLDKRKKRNKNKDKDRKKQTGSSFDIKI